MNSEFWFVPTGRETQTMIAWAKWESCQHKPFANWYTEKDHSMHLMCSTIGKTIKQNRLTSNIWLFLFYLMFPVPKANSLSESLYIRLLNAKLVTPVVQKKKGEKVLLIRYQHTLNICSRKQVSIRSFLT